jgi:hypothetical protein
MTDALDPAAPGQACSRQTLATLVSKMGALPTDDVVHMMVPLMRAAAALHAQGKVGDLGPSGIIEADDGSLALRRPDGQDPILNFDRLKKVQPQAASALNVVGEYRVTADEAVGYRVDDLVVVTDDDTEIKKPIYLRGYRSWESKIGHHDEVTDVFLIGLVLASLACGLDFNEGEDVERFSRTRLNLFGLNPRLHPVIATIILETTALNRHERATDLSSLAKRLLTYRNQPAGLEVERVLAEAKGAPGRRTAVLGHLRDRLFDLSRRNRLIHFRPTQASVNLTESSVPLVLRIESIRAEQICVWSEYFAKIILPDSPVALNTWLRFEEQWSLWPLSAENDVGGVVGRLMFGDAVAERWQVDPGEHRFAPPEHDRGQSEMQLVDQPGAKILTYRLDAATDLHVAALRGELRLLQRRLDTVGHEDEGGAAFHFDWIARMVRQHEGRRVIGRIVAPPALPILVRAGTADRPEHIAAKDERAEPVHRTMCVGLIDAVRAAVLTGHCPEHTRTEHPLVQFQPALAERIFKTLLKPCSESVERDRKACNAHFRHNTLPSVLAINLIA